MAAIALHCKSQNYTYNAQANEYTVGNWVIGKDRRRKLLGAKVILVKSIVQSAYLGGTILRFEPTCNRKCKVIFREDASLVNNDESVKHKGWSNGRRSVCYI